MKQLGRLTFFCGNMGSGKSTKSCQIAKKRNAVLLSEDEWLESLYPNKVHSLKDYIEYSNKLKPLVKSLVQNILKTGADVVMDFPANTTLQREWFKNIFSEIDSPHELIYLDVSNEICLKQIRKRRLEHPERASTDTEAMFEQVTKYFMEPSSDEGFNINKIGHSL